MSTTINGIPAGELKFTCLVQQDNSDTQTTLGGAIPKYETLIPSIHCGFKQLSGKDLFQAQQMEPEATYSVWMRHSKLTKKILPTMLIICRSKRLFVLSARNVDEADVKIECLCMLDKNQLVDGVP